VADGLHPAGPSPEQADIGPDRRVWAGKPEDTRDDRFHCSACGPVRDRTARRGGPRRSRPVSPREGGRGPIYEVRSSAIQGRGVFAARRIRKGTRVLEYTGERISNDEAMARYNDDGSPHAHVVLFTVDDDTVIDGGAGGGDGRFVNHSCAPNCEAVQLEDRIFICALRTVAPGEELTYDYRLERPGRRTKAFEERYACRCGTPACRGTMLEPVGRKPRGARG
jgi:uncharacterized protein